MFTDEAVIASKLQHPNLVEVYELGSDGDEHYIAMEHLYGRDLSRLLRKMRHQRIPLMFQQAITIVRDVAAGLHYAHERLGDDGKLLNIIHRDVSPHNVIVTFAGEVKVVDFGIAKANSQVARTRTGVLKGKAAYMSPEQAMGETVDRRTDVFSMGIVLWELTTGRWLYRRKSELETLKAVVETDAPRPTTLRPDFPKDLEKIIMKALARAPDKRWKTAGDLRNALDELAASWRFRPSAPMITKLMASVFTEEVRAWDDAQNAGISLADHLVAAKADNVLWEDTLGTDPEEALAVETHRAPSDVRETRETIEVRPSHSARIEVRPSQSARISRQTEQVQPIQEEEELEPDSWWWRHRRALMGSLIAGVVVGIAAGILALATSGGGTTRMPGRGTGPTSPGTGPMIEELMIPDAGAAPVEQPRPRPTQPTPPPANQSGSETKVPIVHPPPMPDDKKRKGRNGSDSTPSSPSTSSSSPTGDSIPSP
jgi:serine/threonine protein kinase